MGIFDLQVPFFLPVWRRIILVTVCFAWCIFEFFMASPFWGVIFGALGGYALWNFFLSDWPENADQNNSGSD
jgi:hypothetical protein